MKGLRPWGSQDIGPSVHMGIVGSMSFQAGLSSMSRPTYTTDRGTGIPSNHVCLGRGDVSPARFRKKAIVCPYCRLSTVLMA